MVRERKKVKRLTYEDRLEIEKLYAQGARVDEIAYQIGVVGATIYRELKRGGEPYKADTAQKTA